MNKDNAKDKYCEYNNFKRTRYFHGLLLTDRDFREEQIYHNEKRKLLNRMLHGWGVVCGLGIQATSPESSKIIITPGMALDCRGNEIVVCENFEVDIKKEDICPASSEKDPCVGMEKDKECKYYIAIKYHEVPTDPVPVYTPGGGCEEKACDYSRIREGFCVKLFKTPPCHAILPEDGLVKDIAGCLQGDKPSEQKTTCIKKVQDSFCEQPYPCPACCCEGEPYVVLGSIDFKSTQCAVTTINQDMITINDERRYVQTPMFWQYYLGSFYPPVADFLNNPFIAICQLLERLSKMVVGEGVSPRAEAFTKIATVYKMSEGDAKKVLAEHKVVYNRTITMTPDRIMDIAARAISIEKIESGMKVDLVTDKTGKILFYVPAAEVLGREELLTRLQETEKTVKELQEKIKELGKKIRPND